MDRLIDKLIIFVITLPLYVSSADNTYMVVPILAAIILSSTLSYLEDDRFIAGIFAIYILLCLYDRTFLFFIPLISYDVILFRIKWVWTFALIPVISHPAGNLFIDNILLIAFFAVAFLLKYRTITIENLKRNYYELQYSTKEFSMQLESKNKALMEKQDYEINLATLNERNRIARDIHDNVGHMLSRSILQVGALLAINKDQNTMEGLNSIKDTLSEAMDSIRRSVHNLHEESINLQNEIQKLIDHFEFCPVHLDYDVVENPNINLKYCFIAVIKEALSNVMKHSDATRVFIILREHPGLFQLVIQDNGTKSQSKDSREAGKDQSYEGEKGIGLKSIEDRVEALNGHVHISYRKGFRIFISIPKK
jgi:signal transduction histidine kinase